MNRDVYKEFEACESVYYTFADFGVQINPRMVNFRKLKGYCFSSSFREP